MRKWKAEYQPKDKPLIPVRIIPWDSEFEHVTGSELFGSNLLALTWIKGEAMPGKLVDEILRGLGLERETETQLQQRRRRSSVGHERDTETQQRGRRSSVIGL